NRKAARFDTEKLNWLNQHYLKNAPDETILPELDWHLQRIGLNPDAGPSLTNLLSVQRERFETLTDLAEQSRAFYQDFEHFDAAAAKKNLRPVAEAPLKAIRQALANCDWTIESLSSAVENTAAELAVGMGKIGQPLRVALMGHGRSPSIDQTLWLVGRERTLARIDQALAFIAERAAAAGDH
ncbi:MAG: glutamate--tRNA ligase, partial [Pseudomonadota bacterium]